MKYIKIVFSVFVVLLVSFFVVKSCVHPKRAPYGEGIESKSLFFSKLVSPPHVVIAQRPLPSGQENVPVVSTTVPKMAIVLDDWGKNYPLLKNAIDIHRPLTIAILPNLSKSRQIAEEAYQNGLGVMLHLPMEPKNKNEPLEPHTIMTSMTEKEILKYLDEAVSGVPHLEGANNHMGSAATSDARVMKIILSRLKAQNLFFIDSHVISSTQGPKVAREVGIRFNERDVFIDNENKLDAIKKQLDRAKRIALTHGEVVVIGHDRKLTLQAIQEMIPVFDQAGVKLVYARDVVK